MIDVDEEALEMGGTGWREEEEEGGEKMDP